MESVLKALYKKCGKPQERLLVIKYENIFIGKLLSIDMREYISRSLYNVIR